MVLLKYLLVGFAIMCLGAGGAASGEQPSERRPNVLFLFADDYTYEALGHAGLMDVETPSLDRLARGGTVFTHAYNMGSWTGAVCVASRTMLMTGRSVWRASRLVSQLETEREGGRFWPVAMRAAGYRTYFTGKWHVQAKPELAFEVTRHVRGGMPKDTKACYNRPLSETSDTWSATDAGQGGYWEGGKHWSEVAADDTIDFLQEASGDARPFFIYAAFNAPHDPRQSPPGFLEKYPLSRVSLPASFLPEYPYKDKIGCDPTLRDEALAPFPRTEFAVRVHRREYCGIISHLDAQIGRVLDALEATGRADNTVVFFTADQGLSVGHHGLFGKQNMYDVSVRVPFIMAGAGVPAGQVRSQRIYLQDGMATALDIAGAAKPDYLEFQSLKPILQDAGASSPRAAIYGGYLELQRAITMDGFKLIVYPKAGKVRLYNLREDPWEMKDIASEPRSGSIVSELMAGLVRLSREYEDSVHLEEVFPALVERPE